jgi:hypothetical protein
MFLFILHAEYWNKVLLTFLNDATNNDYLFTPPKYESSYIFYGTPIIQLYLLIWEGVAFAEDGFKY